MRTPQTFGEPLETFVGSGKKDKKGREIGFIVGFNNDGAGDFRAWVQCARRTAPCKWFDFGALARSRGFASQEAATRWAYRTAKERIAKLTERVPTV